MDGGRPASGPTTPRGRSRSPRDRARGLLDGDDLAARYVAWASSEGKGIGRATARALVGARDAADARAHGLAAGDGTVMRATPIGLTARDLRQAAELARPERS